MSSSNTVPGEFFHSIKNPALVPDVKYSKSPEGLAEYKKARLQYPETYIDKAYQEFLERTPDEEGNDYRHKNHTRVTKITRVRQPGGKEFLLYDQVEVRYTPLGNPERFALTNLGRYPVLEMKTQIIEESNGLRRRVATPSGQTKTAYSLEYNLTNIDELHKNSIDNPDTYLEDESEESNPVTQYLLHDLRKQRKISIANYEDFRDGKFEELFEYGKKISSDKEAQDIKAKQEELKQRLENSKLDRLKRSV
jgi:hypothetical protein